jgi:L-lactate permease
MINKLKTFAAIIVVQFGMLFSLNAPLALAQDTGSVSCGAVGSLTDCDSADSAVDTDADDRVNALIKNAIRIFQIIVGLISVFMIITGGLKYITSGGDSGKVGEAKNAILYAVIGLVVVGVAQIIVQFALNRTFGDANQI